MINLINLIHFIKVAYNQKIKSLILEIAIEKINWETINKFFNNS